MQPKSDSPAPGSDTIGAELRRVAKPARVTARAPISHAAVVAWRDTVTLAMGEAVPRPDIWVPLHLLYSWTLPGILGPAPSSPLPKDRARHHLADHGYTSLVATNLDQTYARPLQIGELIAEESCLSDVSDLKKTRLGSGYFVSTHHTFSDSSGNLVGTQDLRVFYFRPPNETPAPPSVPAGAAAPNTGATSITEGAKIEVTPTLIISGAVATNDFESVHHDVRQAREQGLPDIIMNILTVHGLISEYAELVLPHDAEITAIQVALGSPTHPGDELVLCATDRDSGLHPTLSPTPFEAFHDRGSQARASITWKRKE